MPWMCGCREADFAVAIAIAITIARRCQLLGKAWLGAVLIGFIGRFSSILQHNDVPGGQHILSVAAVHKPTTAR